MAGSGCKLNVRSERTATRPAPDLQYLRVSGKAACYTRHVESKKPFRAAMRHTLLRRLPVQHASRAQDDYRFCGPLSVPSHAESADSIIAITWFLKMRKDILVVPLRG